MTLKIPAEEVKRHIIHSYLLSFCSLDRLDDFKQVNTGLRMSQVNGDGLDEADLKRKTVSEVCRLIVAFNQASRSPDVNLVQALSEKLLKSTQSAESLAAFKNQMKTVSALPGRVGPGKRLHKTKGCQFCEAPCQYGYLVLISEPKFAALYRVLRLEMRKPQTEQNVLRAIWSYTICHLLSLTGVKQALITPDHLGNLAYCLLITSMAKSRYILKEEQIKAFQAANQQLIGMWNG